MPVARPTRLTQRLISAKAFILWVACLVVLSGCSVSRHVPSENYLLNSVQVESTAPQATEKMLLADYIQQRPNKKWFGVKVPLYIYSLSRPGSEKKSSRLLRTLGEAPVLYDSLAAERTKRDLTQVLANAGYLHNHTSIERVTKKKRIDLTYRVTPGERYIISSMSREIADPALAAILCGADTLRSLLRSGEPFDINRINEERSRITSLLRRSGYFKFHTDYISFQADTLAGSNQVRLSMHVALQQDNGRTLPTYHSRMTVGDIRYSVDMSEATADQDSITYEGSTIRFGSSHLRFRPSVLVSNTAIRSGELFNESHQLRTYENLMRLRAIASSNIRYFPRDSSDILDVDISVNHARPRSLSFDLEGTNSAGDLGAAASVSIANRNLFRGSEELTFKLRGAYEAITGLDGYEGSSYTEFGGELSLRFPNFLLPVVERSYGARHDASSEIALQYNRQNRPEFNRRVLTAAWRYRWQSHSRHVQHKFDLLEINYIYMPWISNKFKEQYLDSIGKENAILRYNYENLLITKIGYTFSYNSLGNSALSTYGKRATVVKAGIETSGNALSAATHLVKGKRNSNGQRTFCGIAFAQYVKADVEYARSVPIDPNNSVAFHAAAGIAIPYGNSDILPFEKRYFAGGANGVRGWDVRSLGPGAYKGKDQKINFLNQSGDIKLDMSLEYRTTLFWKLGGALFVDAGNIWTIRKYKDQPEGEFRLDKFLEQIAVSYGLGLRMQLDFFTLRLDAGMKAINPAYSSGRAHYPLLHPKFSRDFAFHFAVGLPF